MSHSLKSLVYILLISLSFNVLANNIGRQKDLFKVKDIVVKGLKKVEKEAVLEKITTKKGQVVTNYGLFI